MKKKKKTVLSVKCSVQSLGWKEGYWDALTNYVETVNELFTHSLLFARFIFLREKNASETFSIASHTHERFFHEVFLALTTRSIVRNKKTAADTIALQNLIQKHKDAYLSVSGFQPLLLPMGQQTAAYESRRMVTAYLNNVQERFGSHFRRVINRLLGTKDKIKTIEGDDSTIKERVSALRKAATAFKQLIANRRLVCEYDTLAKCVEADPSLGVQMDDEEKNAYATLRPVLLSYDRAYQFDKGSLYYDVKAHPGTHMDAFFCLAQINEKNAFSAFQVFPLRSSWIPAHTTIDTKILRCHILRDFHDDDTKMQSWRRVLDLKSPALRKQKDLRFRGTISTDGVAVSVLKQDEDSKFNSGGRRTKNKADDMMEPYFTEIERDVLNADHDKMVLIDPNRRDLLYCMSSTSTEDEPCTYRYTSNQKRRETKAKEYRNIRDTVKTEAVKDAENQLSQFSLKTLALTQWEAYLRKRSEVSSLLKSFYTTTKTRWHEQPLHRKLRFGAFIKSKQADERLAKNIKSKFGDDCTLIIGDWAAGHQKFLEPIKGKGMRTILRKKGFPVYLMDEHKTSSLCARCGVGDHLSTFKKRPNSRPFRRRDQPIETAHGLLRCTNQPCLEYVRNRLSTSDKSFEPNEGGLVWNRDTLSVINFRTILHEFIASGTRPERFSRQRKTEEREEAAGCGPKTKRRRTENPPP